MSIPPPTSVTPRTSANAPIRDAVSSFAAGTRLAVVPPPVRAFSSLLLLDTLGALAGGLRYPPVQQLGVVLASTEVTSSAAPFARLMTLGTAATWLDADSGVRSIHRGTGCLQCRQPTPPPRAAGAAARGRRP